MNRAELEAMHEDYLARQALEESDDRLVPARETAIMGYRPTPDLSLLARAAQQDVQLQEAADKLDSMRSQRRWLVGGLAVSVFAFVILAVRRPPRTQLARSHAA